MRQMYINAQSEWLNQLSVSNCWSFYRAVMSAYDWTTHAFTTRSSAVADRPRDASCHWIFR